MLWCFIRVCRLASPMCALDLMKYADLHHQRLYLNCLNQVCQLVSPIILMPTCITHVWSYEVCRLTSPSDIFELPQSSMPTCITHYFYADLHHPCVPFILWSVRSYITQGYIWIASTKYANLYHPLSLCRLASPMCALDLKSMPTYITQGYIWIAGYLSILIEI